MFKIENRYVQFLYFLVSAKLLQNIIGKLTGNVTYII